MKRLIFSLILTLGLVLESSSLAQAEEVLSVQDTLNQLKAKVSSRAAEAKNPKVAAVSGTVEKISSPNFTLKAKSGQSVEVKTDAKTKYTGKMNFTDLKVGGKVSVVKDSSNLAKIAAIQKIKPEKKRAVFGEVEAIVGQTLTLHHVKNPNQKFTVLISDQTQLKVKGVDKATLANVKVGDKVTASGTVDEKGVITAKRLFVVPGKFKGLEKPATPAAKPATSSSNY